MPATGRIHGVDLARAIAVLGMVYAHLTSADPASAAGQAMLQLSDGPPSALFAVLAGVSVSIMGTRAASAGGAEWAHYRHRLLVRGLLLIGMGILLDLWQFSLLVVLMPLGAAMILLSGTPRARSSTLWGLAAAFLFLGPLIQVLLPGVVESSDLFSGGYPLVAWLAYVTVGVLLHRLLIDRPGIQALALVIGVLGTVAGLGLRGVLGTVSADQPGGGPASASGGAPVLLDPLTYTYLSPEGHSGGVIEQLTCICFSLLVIAGCLLLTRSEAVTRLSYPLRALGSMGLSVYVIHVITASMVMGGFTFGMETYESAVTGYEWGAGYPGALVGTVLVAVVAAPLWQLYFRRGPLESVVNRVIAATTDRNQPALDEARATEGSHTT